jgi:hypothetical protein
MPLATSKAYCRAQSQKASRPDSSSFNSTRFRAITPSRSPEERNSKRVRVENRWKKDGIESIITKQTKNIYMRRKYKTNSLFLPSFTCNNGGMFRVVDVAQTQCDVGVWHRGHDLGLLQEQVQAELIGVLEDRAKSERRCKE